MHPDRNERTSNEPARPAEVERERADIGLVTILGGLALLLALGMWYYTKDREMVAGDGTTIKNTTGSGAHELPLPDTPRLPVPTPPQQR